MCDRPRATRVAPIRDVRMTSGKLVGCGAAQCSSTCRARTAIQGAAPTSVPAFSRPPPRQKRRQIREAGIRRRGRLAVVAVPVAAVLVGDAAPAPLGQRPSRRTPNFSSGSVSPSATVHRCASRRRSRRRRRTAPRAAACPAVPWSHPGSSRGPRVSQSARGSNRRAVDEGEVV